MKIGFIGFGNMAKAISNGIATAGLVSSKDVFVFDIAENAKDAAKAMGFTLLENEKEVLQKSELVILAVKPQVFSELLEKIKPDTRSENVFLSIAAGISIEKIAEILGKETAIIRAMPNTPLLLRCGTTVLTCNEFIDADTFSFVRAIFSSVGTVYELPESKFNEVINVNGSTPAYIYLFAKTIVEYADQNGISFDIALPMLCDTLKGSAEMLTNSGYTPDELIQMVSSKGGTTVAALNKFEETGFTDSLTAGMDACLKRARELSGI